MMSSMKLSDFAGSGLWVIDCCSWPGRAGETPAGGDGTENQDKDGFYTSQQRRDVSSRCLPNTFEFDAEVMMDEPVPHAGNLAPRNVCVGRAETIAKVLRCFPKYLEIADDGVLAHRFYEKNGPTSGGIVEDSPGSVAEV